MTKKEMFNVAIEMVNGAEVKVSKEEMIKFFEHEIQLLEKKKGSKKPTKTQRENAELKENIFEVMVKEARPMRVGEIALVLGISTQKVTPQLGNLMTENRVKMRKEKKFTFYSVASAEESAEE